MRVFVVRAVGRPLGGGRLASLLVGALGRPRWRSHTGGRRSGASRQPHRVGGVMDLCNQHTQEVWTATGTERTSAPVVVCGPSRLAGSDYLKSGRATAMFPACASFGRLSAQSVPVSRRISIYIGHSRRGTLRYLALRRLWLSSAFAPGLLVLPAKKEVPASSPGSPSHRASRTSNATSRSSSATQRNRSRICATKRS